MGVPVRALFRAGCACRCETKWRGRRITTKGLPRRPQGKHVNGALLGTLLRGSRRMVFEGGAWIEIRAARERKLGCRSLESDAEVSSGRGERRSGQDDKVLWAITAISGMGAVETAYLTYSKVFGGGAACPTSGCESILSSDYSELLGLPVSLYGLAAYSAVCALSRLAAGDAARKPALLAGATVLASVSAYLAYLLATKFLGETCPYCLFSLLCSFSVFALALSTSVRTGVGEGGGGMQSTLPSIAISPVVVLALAVGLGGVDGSLAGEGAEDIPFKEPLVTTHSSDRSLRIAHALTQAGAKVYGAFWCSHCFDQKQEFGQEAMREFPYVECFPRGWKKGVAVDKACDEADIQGFPTWVIGGKKIEGDQTLDELETILAQTGSVGGAEQAVKS